MQELFTKYLNNQCSPAEVRELFTYFGIPENEETLKNLITESLEDVKAEEEDNQWQPALDRRFEFIKKQINAEKPAVIPIFRRSWFRIAAAVLLVAGGFAVFNQIKKQNPDRDIVKIDSAKQESVGSNKAVLTLANGSTIVLETAENGTLTHQGDVEIVKPVHGQLA